MTLVCRPTPSVRFMHRSEHCSKQLLSRMARLLEHGRVFPHGPAPWNPSKRDLVENVQKNYSGILLHGWKSGNEQSACGWRAFHPLSYKLGAFRRGYSKEVC